MLVACNGMSMLTFHREFFLLDVSWKFPTCTLSVWSSLKSLNLMDSRPPVGWRILMTHS